MIIDEVEERNRLDEFRKLVKDLKQDDSTLKRFLRARNHDLVKAEDMLRKSIDWRQENQVDNALTWEIDEHVKKEHPLEYPGVDRSNRAVMYIPVGSWDVRENLNRGYKDEMLRYIYVCLEKLIENIEKTGEQFTLIVDLEEMSYWKVAHYDTMQMTLKVFRDFETNYPERLGEAMVINAPMVLNYVWPLITPLLTGHTLRKVRFLGSNPVKYIPQILERVPASSLPLKLSKLMKLHDISA